MKYTDEQLNEAVENDIFSPEQVNKFRIFVQNYNNHITKFQKTLYYGGGLLFSISIAVTPLLVFSILRGFDFWPQEWSYNDYYIWIKGKWIILEISVILVALPILFKTKFPFLSRLSWEFFKGSVLFPFALTIIGVSLIFSGIFFQKNRKNIENNFINKLPVFILKLRPKRNI